MKINSGSKGIQITWTDTDTPEVKEIVQLLVQLAKILVMLSYRTTSK